MPFLDIGEIKLVQGSGKDPYKVKNINGDGFSCTCVGWRNCRADNVDNKECKHTKPERAAYKAAHGGSAAFAIPLPVPAAGVGKTARTAPLPTVSVLPTGDDVAAMAELKIRWSDIILNPWNPLYGDDEQYDRAISSTRVCMQLIEERRLGRKMRADELAGMFGPPCILAQTYGKETQPDTTCWLESEKLDGVRAYWNGRRIFSRQGNVYRAPDWFTAVLPRDRKLDGELWMGRQMMQTTISVVKSGPSERWRGVSYVLYDLPEHGGPFRERIAKANQLFPHDSPGHVRTLPHRPVQSVKHMFERLAELVKGGAEGLMLRALDGLYEDCRSSNLLKLKPWQDAEAVVFGYNDGKGSNTGVTGGLKCRMPNGNEFSLGQLTAEQRRVPPKIGATITYKYTELTRDGIPKCASLIGERNYE